MPTRTTSRRRALAQHMDTRRRELRLRWADVARDAHMTTEGLRGIRQGDGKIMPLSKQGIEDALAWEQGSIDEILAGRKPRPRRVVVSRDVGSPLRDELHRTVDRVRESALLEALNALQPFVDAQPSKNGSESR